MFKVLLVEDEEMIRKGLRYTFDWLGADCVVIDEASNGEEGLQDQAATTGYCDYRCEYAPTRWNNND